MDLSEGGYGASSGAGGGGTASQGGMDLSEGPYGGGAGAGSGGDAATSSGGGGGDVDGLLTAMPAMQSQAAAAGWGDSEWQAFERLPQPQADPSPLTAAAASAGPTYGGYVAALGAAGPASSGSASVFESAHAGAAHDADANANADAALVAAAAAAVTAGGGGGGSEVLQLEATEAGRSVLQPGLQTPPGGAIGPPGAAIPLLGFLATRTAARIVQGTGAPAGLHARLSAAAGYLSHASAQLGDAAPEAGAAVPRRAVAMFASQWNVRASAPTHREGNGRAPAQAAADGGHRHDGDGSGAGGLGMGMGMGLRAIVRPSGFLTGRGAVAAARASPGAAGYLPAAPGASTSVSASGGASDAGAAAPAPDGGGSPLVRFVRHWEAFTSYSTLAATTTTLGLRLHRV
jgi:hypothetical protein